MIVTCIYGGLGNQMFQYAVGRSLSLLRGAPLKLDITWFPRVKGTVRKYDLDVFPIVEDFASEQEILDLRGNEPHRGIRLLRRVTRTLLSTTPGTYFKEHRQDFDESVFALEGDVYLEGYWQNERYFRKVADTILKDFTLKEDPSGKNREMAERISNTPSVSIHIRRGDYVTNPDAAKLLGFRGVDYVQKAVSVMLEKCSAPSYYVFSDDIEWCRDNLHLDRETVFVDHNGEGGAHEDMRLMSRCKHNIITNSSFSWWAAWLNSNPDKTVIAPREWFKGDPGRSKAMSPDSWRRL